VVTGGAFGYRAWEIRVVDVTRPVLVVSPTIREAYPRSLTRPACLRHSMPYWPHLMDHQVVPLQSHLPRLPSDRLLEVPRIYRCHNSRAVPSRVGSDRRCHVSSPRQCGPHGCRCCARRFAPAMPRSYCNSPGSNLGIGHNQSSCRLLSAVDPVAGGLQPEDATET